MPTVKQLQEDRAPIGAQIRKMADTLGPTKPDFTAEERSQWDRLNRDFDALTRQIQSSDTEVENERARQRGLPTPGLEDTPPREKRSAGAVTGEEVWALALQAWCRKQSGLPLTDAHKRACKVLGLSANRKTVEIHLPRRPGRTDKRSLSIHNPSAGAVAVADGFVRNLEKAMKDYNGVRQVADVIRTADGATMPWPTVNDTSNEGELIGENQPVTEQDPQFGVVNFGAYKFSSKLIKVPSELLEDSAFDFARELSALLGERLGRVSERYYTVGIGAGQPTGFLHQATLGKTAASQTTFVGDEIIDLIHSIDPAYRRDPSFGIMLHDLALAVIRKLKDSQGRYLFEEGQNGAPDRVKGVRLIVNQNMPSAMSAGQKVLACGAWRKVKIRDVNVVRMKRLEERYAEYDQVGFVGFMRTDSKVLDAGTHPIKYLALAP